MERRELERLSRSHKGHAAEVWRGQCLLVLEEGVSWVQILTQFHCDDTYIVRWSRRLATQPPIGLYRRHCGQPPTVLSLRMEVRILD